MTVTDTEAAHVDPDLKKLGEQLLRTARANRYKAAAQALVEEKTILSNPAVRRALIVDTSRGKACNWEGLAGHLYTVGLDEAQRAFLGLVMSMVGMGHVPLSAVEVLDERRLVIMQRALLRLASNDTIAVGTLL
ncbi:hypothetical protein AB0K80_00270 [Streptomyces sp. NPDC052682]|uniref:hypothetical protein n=1 Tax=Streptomyces sp. NPDC052682 TaxID=3154954 RepID=UPI003429768D